MHLDEGQMLAILEGGDRAASSSHLSTCSRCRQELDALARVVARVSDAEVPEPSPLFWTHFRSRISEAIANPTSETPLRSANLGFKWLTAATVILSVVLILLIGRASRETVAPVPAGIPDAPVVLTASDLSDGDIDSDEAWAVVRSIADDLDYDSAHGAGLAPAPDSLDRAAVALSAAEQAALVALIEAEMKRTES